MKPILLKRYITVLFLAVAFVAGGTAVAGDKRLTLTLVTDSGEIFEVKAPANAPLHAMKKKFMAELGLSVKDSEDFVIQRGSVTPTVDVPYVRTVPTGDPELTYETLDDGSSLKKLGVEDGDTLHLKQV